MGNDPPRQAYVKCPLGVDGLAGEEQLHGVGPRHFSGEADGPHDGGDADGDLWPGEGGPVRGHDEVTRDHGGEAVAQARPVDRGDGRLEHLETRLERVDRGDLPEGAGEVAGGAVGVTQVSAPAEVAVAGPGQYGHPGFLLGHESFPGGVQVAAHGTVHGVGCLGPVVGDGGHMAVAFVGGGRARGLGPFSLAHGGDGSRRLVGPRGVPGHQRA